MAARRKGRKAAAFNSVAIVNRGEAAMRLIHAVREYNREHGLEIETIAIYTEPEQNAMFVREADRAVSLGPAFFVDAEGQRKNAYLNYDALEKALVESGAEAVWVGWGFVAEHPAFADLCQQKLGLNFIGPDGDCMRQLGDKITSKLMAEKAGVPVAPWSGGPVENLEEAKRQADRIGFFEYDDTHGWSKPRREATYRWLERWFHDRDDEGVEPTFDTEATTVLTPA